MFTGYLVLYSFSLMDLKISAYMRVRTIQKGLVITLLIIPAADAEQA